MLITFLLAMRKCYSLFLILATVKRSLQESYELANPSFEESGMNFKIPRGRGEDKQQNWVLLKDGDLDKNFEGYGQQDGILHRNGNPFDGFVKVVGKIDRSIRRDRQFGRISRRDVQLGRIVKRDKQLGRIVKRDDQLGRIVKRYGQLGRIVKRQIDRVDEKSRTFDRMFKRGGKYGRIVKREGGLLLN